MLKAQISTGATNPESSQPSERSDIGLQLKVKELEAKNAEYEEEIGKIRKDQEDLLELLTDQDIKLQSFKNRLRDLGENVDDPDSDNNSIGSDNE